MKVLTISTLCQLVWWRMIAGPFFRMLMRLGVWHVKKGDYYVNGRLGFGGTQKVEAKEWQH